MYSFNTEQEQILLRFCLSPSSFCAIGWILPVFGSGRFCTKPHPQKTGSGTGAPRKGDPHRRDEVHPDENACVSAEFCLNGEYPVPCAGTAWSTSLPARRRLTTSGYDIDTPKSKGDIGLSLTPSAGLPPNVDLGVQAIWEGAISLMAQCEF